jgi:hypothetical protein
MSAINFPSQNDVENVNKQSLPHPKFQPQPDFGVMTGTFTTGCYLIIDANGSYGQVKLAIQKQSAEKVSSYEAEYFSLANIHNSPDMITIAAITAITAIAKSRKIFTTPSKQQLITFKERHRLQPQRWISYDVVGG